MSDTIRTYLDFAVETAWQAGQLTLGYYQTGVRPDMKADASPVTEADRQAERLIRERIQTRYPGHALVGEEYGEEGTAESSHRWIIDPIDGTRAFVRGVPMYAVLIGLEIEGEVVAGVAHFPALNELLAAGKGLGCWWNGRPARCSTVSRLSDAMVTHADAASFAQHGRGRAWEQFKALGGFRYGWADAYAYLLVATGRAEVALDPIMSVWDSAPFLPILNEAGGYFGDWDGNPTIYANEGVATTNTLRDEVLAITRLRDE